MRCAVGRCTAAIIAAALTLAACGGSASSSSPAATTTTSGATTSGPDTAAFAPDSVWSHVLSRVQSDGQVSVGTALAAFAAAIGPVPGAVVPAGVAAPVESGTLAVMWVRSHWGELSAAQRRAVLSDLGTTLSPPPVSGSAQGDVVPADLAVGRAPKPPRPTDPNLFCATSDSAGAAPYRAQVAGITAEIGARIGVPFTIPVYLEVNTQNVTKGGPKDEALAYTVACDGAQYVPGVINGCVVHVEPRLVSDGVYSDADVRGTLIHELMHCFLYQQFGARYDHMPAWYLEGVPEWVESVLGGDAVDDGWWIAYLNSDSEPLFTRTYSAMGFYTHLADVGTNPWTVILPIGQAFIASGYSNLAGWKAAGVTKDFLDSWGSGYAQGRYPGTAWVTGANLPHYEPDLGPVEPVTDTTVRPIGAFADSSTIRQLDIDAPIIKITTSAGANGRISLGGGNDTTLDQTAGVNYCSDSSGCVCPSTSPQADATFTHIDSGIEYASVSGDTTTATMTLTGMSLPAFCAKRCLVGTWVTTGQTIQPPGIYGSESGGAGVTWVITAAGGLTIDYAGSTPVQFFGNSITYRGNESGTITVPKDPQARSGTYRLGDVTANVTESTALGGSQLDPRDATAFTGTYTCGSNSTLQITEPIGHGSSQIFSFHGAQ
jgi:hypothetical protein